MASNSSPGPPQDPSIKLQAILDPADLGELELADIIDHEALQTMMEQFYRITRIGIGILDVHGKVLVCVGWQDVCTTFHRVHPDTLKNCHESDVVLARGVSPGTFKAYRCKNNLWDIMTPIEVGGRHLGKVFLGQFFYDDETPDHDLFRRQARRYGFDEEEYLAAIERVPRWSRETVESTMAFYSSLSAMISSLGYSTIKLSRTVFQKDAALRQLDASKAIQASLLEAIPIPVFYKDTAGRYLGCNRAFEALFGLTRDQVTNKTVFDLQPHELAQTYHARDTELFEAPGSQVYEGQVRDAHGLPRDVVFHKASLIDSQGTILGLIGAILDITERKQAEQEKIQLEGQLQQALKMEAIGQLAGGVAHDFNNMLGVIQGQAEMAMEQLDPSHPLFAALQEIRKAASRSADMTRQLLAFARKQVVAPTIVDLNETIEGMLQMLRRLIGEDIELAWLPGANLWPIKIDPSQIDQILANLFVNARAAIAGVGKIAVETGNCTIDEDDCDAHAGFVSGEYARIAVSDDGAGMDRETLAHIFEPFFTTKSVGEGTGLGLATVYGAVKQNNGFIDAHSEPGQGTTFTIYLPRHVGQARRRRTTSTAKPTPHGHETILLVEDELTILKMATTMLKRLGYTVLTASTADAAIRLAHEHTGEIDLLLTDVIMPQVNGRDLAHQLMASQPGMRCLFMSGYAADIIADHSVLDEGLCFIQKPFTTRDLAAKVREALDTRDRLDTPRP